MSWNNYPKIKSNNIEFLTQNFELNSQYDENLAYGLGRSYGDVCLNENGNIIVIDNNGSLYPAKDARMSSDTFTKSFDNLEFFSKFVDPKFSSSFWRRVNI